jgi:hypothetical protein
MASMSKGSPSGYAEGEAGGESGRESPVLPPRDVFSKHPRGLLLLEPLLDARAGVGRPRFESPDEVLVVAHAAFGLDRDGQPFRVLRCQGASSRATVDTFIPVLGERAPSAVEDRSAVGVQMLLRHLRQVGSRDI